MNSVEGMVTMPDYSMTGLLVSSIAYMITVLFGGKILNVFGLPLEGAPRMVAVNVIAFFVSWAVSLPF